MDLRDHYLNYIAAINDGCKPGSLDPFVHEGVIYNDSPPLSIADYAKNMTEAQASFTNLSFNLDIVIVEADKDKGDQGNGNFAVRISLTFEAESGREETFHENVFYRFEGGKIKQVWSMVDGAGRKWAEERAKRKE